MKKIKRVSRKLLYNLSKRHEVKHEMRDYRQITPHEVYLYGHYCTNLEGYTNHPVGEILAYWTKLNSTRMVRIKFWNAEFGYITEDIPMDYFRVLAPAAI